MTLNDGIYVLKWRNNYSGVALLLGDRAIYPAVTLLLPEIVGNGSRECVLRFAYLCCNGPRHFSTGFGPCMVSLEDARNRDGCEYKEINHSTTHVSSLRLADVCE
jgi:hypothetical protein